MPQGDRRRRAEAPQAAEQPADSGRVRVEDVEVLRKQIERLQGDQQELWNQTSEPASQEVQHQLRLLKRKVDKMAKGQFIVLEGTERVEKVYREEVLEDGGQGWEGFKELIPNSLVQELGVQLGIKQASDKRVQDWEDSQEEGERAKQDCKDLKKLHRLLAEPRQIVNVQLQYHSAKGKGKGKGKDKGKKGKDGDKGKSKGKDKGKDKGKGKARERKERFFVLELRLGTSATPKIRKILESRVENRLREAAGMVVTKKPTDVEEGVKGETGVDQAAPGVEGSGDVAMTDASSSSSGKKRLLIFVEKTEEEKEWKRQRKEQESGGSGGKGKGSWVWRSGR